jgi:glyoxylase-like metal-dependent hydrolase (beta-lactamase superfamily II)
MIRRTITAAITANATITAAVLTTALTMLGAAAAQGTPAPADASAAVGKPPFREPWIDGTSAVEPEMQVQQFNADTFVIRQSIRTNVEGPFIFLFFGMQRVLEIDTGAGGLKIRPTIDKIISQWAEAKGLNSMELVIAHSHAHDDHIAGDTEFADRPDTRIVGHAPAQVAEFFHIRSWPQDIEPFDLGGRVLDIIPMPGHEPAEISVFDRKTHLLLMGDELYPGRLYIPADEFDHYKKSIERVVNFTRARGVSWILGNHIEMTRIPGRDYAFHAPNHPGERRLELPYARLLELNAAVQKMGGQPRLEIHHDFIIYPLP